MDPSKRFITTVLATGALVLLAAIFIGERMGSRVFVQIPDSGSVGNTEIVTPLPASTPGDGYGPDWKRSQTLTAAGDPGFPDPRVPPVPLPTPVPTPKQLRTPHPRWTPNPNLPIWDQTSPPSVSPSPSASPPASPGVPAKASPGSTASAKASPTPLP